MKGGDKVKNGAEKTEELFKKYGDADLQMLNKLHVAL